MSYSRSAPLQSSKRYPSSHIFECSLIRGFRVNTQAFQKYDLKNQNYGLMDVVSILSTMLNTILIFIFHQKNSEKILIFHKN
jgi:hypothetical protein